MGGILVRPHGVLDEPLAFVGKDLGRRRIVHAHDAMLRHARGPQMIGSLPIVRLRRGEFLLLRGNRLGDLLLRAQAAELLLEAFQVPADFFGGFLLLGDLGLLPAERVLFLVRLRFRHALVEYVQPFLDLRPFSGLGLCFDVFSLHLDAQALDLVLGFQESRKRNGVLGRLRLRLLFRFGGGLRLLRRRVDFLGQVGVGLVVTCLLVLILIHWTCPGWRAARPR